MALIMSIKACFEKHEEKMAQWREEDPEGYTRAMVCDNMLDKFRGLM